MSISLNSTIRSGHAALNKAWAGPLLLAMLVMPAFLGGCSSVPRQAPEAPAAAAAPNGPSSDELAALDAIKTGHHEEALARFEALTKAHPDSPGAFVNLGLLQLDAGNLEAAEAAFKHAVDLKPRLPAAYNGLGIAYREMGRFGDAEAAYLKALQYAPDYGNAHLNLAILYDIYLDRPDAALAHYERYKALAGSDGGKVDTWIAAIKLSQLKNKEKHP